MRGLRPHPRNMRSRHARALAPRVLVVRHDTPSAEPVGPPVGYEWDILGGTLRWGAEVEMVFGHAAGEPWTLDAWSGLVHPHDLPLVDHSLVEALEAGAPSWTAQYRLRRPDGSYADVLDVGRIERDARGRPTRVVGSLWALTGGAS